MSFPGCIWLSLAAVLLVACSGSAATEEADAGAGFVFVYADPATTPVAITLELSEPSGAQIQRLQVGPGQRVIGQIAASPGPYLLTVGPGGCSVNLELRSGSETDVLLTENHQDRCVLHAQGEHPEDQPGHRFGTAFVTLSPDRVNDLTVSIMSVDSPPNPVPSPVSSADEAGRFFISPLAPGEYDVQALRNGRLVGSGPLSIGNEGTEARVVIEVGP